MQAEGYFLPSVPFEAQYPCNDSCSAQGPSHFLGFHPEDQAYVWFQGNSPVNLIFTMHPRWEVVIPENLSGSLLADVSRDIFRVGCIYRYGGRLPLPLSRRRLRRLTSPWSASSVGCPGRIISVRVTLWAEWRVPW